MRKLVNCDISEDHLKNSLLVVASVELLLFLYVVHPELFYDLLHAVLKEAFVRIDLLSNKSILFEIAVDYFPAVVLVDRVHVGPIAFYLHL